MSEIAFTKIDRILGNLSSDLRGTNLHERDIIGWIGKALEFLHTPEILVEKVAFMKVKNFEAEIPKGFKFVLQIARYEKEEEDMCRDCNQETISEKLIQYEDCLDLGEGCEDFEGEILDCSMAHLLGDFRPYFDMQWQFAPWTVSNYYKENFSVVRLANHSLFNSIVCREKGLNINYGEDQYTIVGDYEKKLRFSFEEGYIALAYLATPIDKETGYPLIPDLVQHITAAEYFVKWKLAEVQFWNNIEGASQKVQYYNQQWIKYAGQAKSYAKIPKSLDEFQNMLEESHQLIPRRDRYYNYFGNLGRKNSRNFENRNLN